MIGLIFKNSEDEERFYYEDKEDFFNSDEYIEYLKKETDRSKKTQRKKDLEIINRQLNIAIDKLEQERRQKSKKLPIIVSSNDILNNKKEEKITNKKQQAILDSLIELFNNK